MSLPILILFTFILNILFSMTSSIVSTNKEIEDESYKYQATLKWLSLCMEIFGIVMSVIYLQPMIHTPLLYVVVLLLVYVYILLSDLLPRKFANVHLNQFEKPFMSIAKGIQTLCTHKIYCFICIKIYLICVTFSICDRQNVILQLSIDSFSTIDSNLCIF